ncbi:MAG TPA: PAS domain S-box protein [Nitrospiraceae bacterium]|nr:PAS domain S-box protein [Nitrospiraceae bacterium]
MPDHILIVDDDAVMLQALKGVVAVRLPTIIIDTCESAAAALERIGDTDYDAIVSDVKMPGMDGFQFMERVLKTRPTTPTLLITGHGDRDMGVKALNAGAYAFIPKPIDRDFFLAWLKRAIQLRQLSRTVERHTEALEQTVRERTAELERNNLQLQTVSELHRESEALYRSMAEAMPQIVYTTGPDGGTDYVSQQWVQYTGVSKSKALKLEWMHVLHPDDVPRAEQRWSEAVRDGTICETEYRLRRADGEYRWHLSRAVPQRDEQGRLIKWIGTSTDIHDRKRSEEALRDSEDRYKRLVKFSPDAILIDRGNRIVFVNEAGLALFRAAHRDELLGTSPFGLFHLECRPFVKERMTRLREDHESLAMAEERIVRLDGTVVDVEVVASSFLDRGERAIHLILRDITERKQAEKALRDHEQQLRLITDTAPVYIVQCDTSVRYKFVNKPFAERLGMQPEDCIGKHIEEVVGLQAYESFRRYVDMALSGHAVEFEATIPYDALGRRYMHCSYKPEFGLDGAVQGFIAVISDITHRREAEKALRENTERLRAALAASETGTFRWDMRTNEIEWDDALDRLFGLSPGSTIHSPDQFLALIHPDDRAGVADACRRCVEEGADFEMEYRVIRPDGTEHWLYDKGKTFFDEAGHPLYMAGACVDVTKRKQTEKALSRSLQELRDKQEQLVQAAKLASLGEVATGVAHEINNPLNNIGLFVGNVLDTVREGPIDRQQVARNLAAAIEQTKKAATIVEHLRTFGRRASAPFEPVNLNRIVQASVSLIEAQFRVRNIDLTLDLSPHDPLVMGNSIQLEQVFINLLANARDAVERAPSKIIRIESTSHGPHVEVRVRDTGIGIPADAQSRIFDPFFTTKEVGKGTGLGLSISYGIIKEHQGEIAVESRPGQGATFTIRLPRIENE